MRDHNHYLTSVVVSENPSTNSLGQLTCLDEQVKISQVFHCDGLLLCILEDDNTRIVVWNPYLGQTRWIKTNHVERSDMWRTYKYRIGYGYNNHKNRSCRSYKILKSRDISFGYHLLSYETYDLDSNLWTPCYWNPKWNMTFYDCGVSLKGNTYWYVAKSQSTICFDFTRMRFGEFQDLPFRATYNDLVTMSCVGDEKLSVLVQYMNSFVINVWITNKIEEQKMSWNKFLRVDMGPLSYLRILEGCFFIDEEMKVVMVFNKDRERRLDTVNIFGEDGYFRELVLGEPSDQKRWPLVCSYVPSLAQINQSTRERQKEKTKQLGVSI